MTGQEIKLLRDKLGLSQSELAAILGVTRNTVARWETDWRECRGPAVAMMRRMLKDGRAVPV